LRLPHWLPLHPLGFRNLSIAPIEIFFRLIYFLRIFLQGPCPNSSSNYYGGITPETSSGVA
jgi:hypothetical protein